MVNQCNKCQNIILETVYYCDRCFYNSFKQVSYTGKGTVITYTIQAVVPEGFEDVNSYAWVIFKLDDCDINVSGFLPGISSPADLPLGSKVKVIDFHDTHGLILKKYESLMLTLAKINPPFCIQNLTMDFNKCPD